MDNLTIKKDIVISIFNAWKRKYEDGNLQTPEIEQIKEHIPSIRNKEALYFFRLFFNYLVEKGEIPCEINRYTIRNFVCSELFNKYKITNVFNLIEFPVELDVLLKKLDYFPKMLYPEFYSKEEIGDKFLWDNEYLIKYNCRSSEKDMLITTDNNHERNIQKILYIFNCFLADNPVPIEGCDSISNYYDFFISKNADKYIKKSPIKNIYKSYFSSPLELFYRSLREDERNPFLYDCFQFLSIYRQKDK